MVEIEVSGEHFHGIFLGFFFIDDAFEVDHDIDDIAETEDTA